MRRNSLVGAPIRHDVVAVRQALATPAADYPDSAIPTPARVSLASRVGRPPAPAGRPKASVDRTGARASRLHPQVRVAPAAAAVLGRYNPRNGLMPLWRKPCPAQRVAALGRSPGRRAGRAALAGCGRLHACGARRWQVGRQIDGSAPIAGPKPARDRLMDEKKPARWLAWGLLTGDRL